MKLDEIVKLECCVPDFTAGSKQEALKKIAEIMKAAPGLEQISQKDIYSALAAREEKGSTGFTHGIAIPHCQLEGLQEFVVGIIVSKKGVHFDAMDKKKSRVLLVILGPPGASNRHLKLLAQVSGILKEKETLELLIRSESRTALLEAFLKNAHQDDLRQPKPAEKNMLMFMVVRDERTLEDITEIIVEYGIRDAVLFEAEKMENLLTKIPLFLGFFNFTEEKERYNRLVLATINGNYLNALLTAFKDRFGDLETYSALSIHVVKLHFSIG